MIEIALLGVIGLLTGLLAWEKYEGRKERSKLINALLAKKPEDLVSLDIADKAEFKAPKDQPLQPSDLVPENELTMEEWEARVINGTQ